MKPVRFNKFKHPAQNRNPEYFLTAVGSTAHNRGKGNEIVDCRLAISDLHGGTGLWGRQS